MPSTPAKSRMVFILLAVFLGSLGVHNFYAGRNTNGVIQLVITLVGMFFGLGIGVWVWALIEAFTVTEDANGVPFV